MPSDKHNLITAKATGLIFSLFNVLRPERCLLAYHSMYNAFFMDLPVSHLFFQTAKSVDLVHGAISDALCMGSPIIIL